MKSVQSLLGGMLAALVTGLLVLGALTLSLTESNLRVEPAPPTAAATLGPAGETLTVPPLLPPTPAEPGSSPTPWPLPAQPTPLPICLPPQGWLQYTVQPGDTLAGLAGQHQIGIELLRSANCLLSDDLLPYTYIYLPPGQPLISSTPTLTAIPCGAPAGWVQITLSAGDTLYSLSREYNITIYQLQQANCMGYSTRLYAGSKFWVPNVPTRTPTATEPPAASATPPLPTPTATVPSIGGVTLVPQTDARSGDPGTTITYTLTLTNTGNFSDSYTLSAAGANWTSTISPGGIGPLAAGAFQTLTVSVSIPAAAAGGSTDMVTITATSQANGAVSAAAVLTTTANNLASYGVTLSPAAAAQSGTPGSAVTYILTLTNTGTVPDTFDLSLSGAAWTTTVPPTGGPLNAGASQEITVTVNIPTDVPNGASDTATISAVSQGDQTAAATSVLTTTAAVKIGGKQPAPVRQLGTIPATRASHNTATRVAL